MSIFRPMLASPVDLASLRYPVIVSPKFDGVRAVKWDKLMSRTNKPIPNQHVQSLFSALPRGLDGELIVGLPYAQNVYRKTVSTVMSFHDTTPVRFYAFDMVGPEPFVQRLGNLMKALSDFPNPHVTFVEQTIVESEKALLEYETLRLREGFEGIMVRSMQGKYKQGRSTVREGWMLKMKRFADSEATIIGFEELLWNANEAKLDERGYTTHSSHQENLIKSSTLGAFVVRDAERREFKIGTGFTQEERVRFWLKKEEYLNRIVKFKHFPHGEKDLPRHPVFLGFRDPIDVSVD